MRYTAQMEPQEQTPTTPVEAKKTLISIPAAIVTGSVIIAIAVLLTLKPQVLKPEPQQQQPGTPTSVNADVVTIRSTDYVRGNAQTADVVIYEYVDTDCYYCQQFHPTLKTVVEESKGKVAWVTRHFPLAIHPNAYAEALALECAGKLGGNAAFWKYFDSIIDITLTPNPTSNSMLTKLATDEGISASAFKTCIEDPNTAKRIDADSTEAQSIGARGTPFSILVNKDGKQLVIPGAYPLEQMRAAIQSLL